MNKSILDSSVSKGGDTIKRISNQNDAPGDVTMEIGDISMMSVDVS